MGYVRDKIRANSARTARQNASPSWEKHVKEAVQRHLKGRHRVVPKGDNDRSYANLQEADLSGANLPYANLEDANLSYADLSGADLSGANLKNANLTYANLVGANLKNANLTFADLRWANLEDADLTYADLRVANLVGAIGLTPKQIAYAKKQKAWFGPQTKWNPRLPSTVFRDKIRANTARRNGFLLEPWHLAENNGFTVHGGFTSHRDPLITILFVSADRMKGDDPDAIKLRGLMVVRSVKTENGDETAVAGELIPEGWGFPKEVEEWAKLNGNPYERW